MMHLKFLENQEQTKSKTSGWREIINIRAEINNIENILSKNQRNKKIGSWKKLTRSTNSKST
jgi:hypothetical protein